MYFLFDIGGTNIRLSLIENIHSEPNVVKIPTPASFAEGIYVMKDFLEKNNAIDKIKMSVGGTTGVLDRGRNELVSSFHLPEWKNKPLKNMLMGLTKNNVVIENDSALATLGEAVNGIAQDYEIVAYITVSTGLGGSRVVNKTLDKNNFNFEIGHQIIDIDGQIHYLEDVVSGSGIQRRYGIKAEDITDSRVWQEIEFYLAIGLNNVILHWSPDIIVIGGAVGRTLNLDNVRKRLKQVMRIYPELPIIQKSSLRHNGIHGAKYLLQNLI